MNRVVLLIPHYNNPEGLSRSLASIDASETIDVVIVDDGSKKSIINETIVNKAFTANGSVKYIYMLQNKGIEHALNAGLDYIQKAGIYKYIARLDTGDFCVGKRFVLQQEFLERNPDIKLLGTNTIAVDTHGKILFRLTMPAATDEIRKKMFVNCMFIHPTVMFRADVLPDTGFYPVNRKSAEDYAFFFKIVNQFETANLQEFLVKIEINPSGISLTQRKQQVASRLKVIRDNFKFGFYPVYGLVRNVVIYFTPNSLIMFLKKKIK